MKAWSVANWCRKRQILIREEPGGASFLEYLRDPYESENVLSPIPRGTNSASDGVKILKKFQPDITWRHRKLGWCRRSLAENRQNSDLN